MPTPRSGESHEEMRARVNARDRAARRQWAATQQTVQLDANGTMQSRSITYAPEREPYKPLPNAMLARRSALVDAENNVLQQWLIEKPEDRARYEAWEAYARALAAGLPVIEPIPPPSGTSDSLMAFYPVGDHHLGMLSWKQETGASYDIDIGERLLAGAIDHLTQATPACQQAAVVFLGDFMHYDSFVAATPTNNNPLDADGRFPKMASAAMRVMMRVIEAAARRHGHVHVVIEIGNHDLTSSIWLQEALSVIYQNNPRIAVDRSPKHFHYIEFGRNLIGIHHGHGPKMAELPGIMAHDRAEAWGRTTHRFWWTGHIHTQRAYDYPGCSVESFRILPPTDAWAANEGYRSKRDMKAVMLHKEFGEVARYTVSPEMLDA
ncbi:MAG: hypothetical protein ACREDH_15600 [Methylocella sp.]